VHLPKRASANTNAQFGAKQPSIPSCSSTTTILHDTPILLPHHLTYRHHCWPPSPTTHNQLHTHTNDDSNTWQHHVTRCNDHQNGRRRWRMPKNDHTHQRQCGNATSLAPMTTRTAADDKECPRRNTNDPTAHKWRPAPTNGHRWRCAKVSQLTPPPPPAFFFSNTKCRCHIAVSDVATKQQMTTKNHCLLLLLGHHSKYPPQFVPTHLAHTQHDNGPMTWDNDNAARTGTTMTWHNDRWRQGCPTTTQPGHAVTTCG